MSSFDSFVCFLNPRTQHIRGLNSARAAASRSRANAEARLVARVSCGLRLCSLDRACGEEVADVVGTTALTQALAAALRLPSRFPRGGVSPWLSADCHRLGAYVQAAKVRTGLGRTDGRATARREGVFGTTSNDLALGGCPPCCVERRDKLENACQWLGSDNHSGPSHSPCGSGPRYCAPL